MYRASHRSSASATPAQPIPVLSVILVAALCLLPLSAAAGNGSGAQDPGSPSGSPDRSGYATSSPGTAPAGSQTLGPDTATHAAPEGPAEAQDTAPSEATDTGSAPSPSAPPPAATPPAASAPADPPTAEISGVSDEIAGAALRSVGDSQLRCDTPRWIVRSYLRRVETELGKLLRGRGHYAPSYDTALSRSADCWVLSIAVERGEQTRIRSIDLVVQGPGEDDPKFREILDAPGIAVGEGLREARYETLKGRLVRVALERGYFDADFTSARIDVYAPDAAADVTLRFETGMRYRFGDLDIDVAPTELRDDLLERITRWQPDALYELQQIQNLRTRLQAAGYFADVDVQADPDAREAGRVPVTASASLRARHELSSGIGFATDLGPRLNLGYENRYVNARGHQAGANLDLSPVVQEQRFSYRMPTSGSGDPWLVFTAGFLAEDTDTADSETISAGVRRIHGGPWNLRITEFIDLSREDFNVAADDDVAILLVPGISVGRSERTRVRPLELGWRFEVRLSGAAEPLATTSFTQAQFDLERAFPLGEVARVVSRVRFGTTWTDALADLPTSVRYFAGGDQSIRGYALDAVGPVDDNGEVRGGRHLLVGSLELERMVWNNFSAALFVDSGGAFNDFSEPMSTGVGLGVRWQSPFGPVRLDFAHPLDDPDSIFRVHFGIGSSFR